MAAWMKIAAVLAGLFGLAAVVTVFGLPPRPVQAPATATATASAEDAAKAAEATRIAEAAKAAEAVKLAEATKTAEAAKVAAARTGAEPAKPGDAGAAASPAPAAATQVARADPKAGTAPAEPLAPPTFDIVRVLPTGEVVVAGRAAPNASVELVRNGVVYHKVIADAAGQFAMVPPDLGPGSHDLTLVITLPDGRREVSRQSVAVSVPAGGSGNVVVALASPDKPTEILSQLPSAAASKSAPAVPAATPGERPGVVLGSVEVEESGRFFATGRSAPGAVVRLYLNDTFLAAATASPEGTWSFAINRGVEPGSYRVRIDDVDGKGTVLSRAEVPFEFGGRIAGLSGGSRPAGLATGPVLMPTRGPTQPAGPQVASTEPTAPGGANVVVEEIRTTTVSRGDSLWRISKRIYGKGLRYTVIYEANQKQIRNPKLIYPGQLFVLPGEQPN